jgi:hypothetical protein
MAAAAEDSKEGLRVPTGDAEPNSTSEQGELMRLNIQERQSGCPLYDRVWKWKEDQKSPSQASQIVSFFFQFAREIDKGAVRSRARAERCTWLGPEALTWRCADRARRVCQDRRDPQVRQQGGLWLRDRPASAAAAGEFAVAACMQARRVC